MIHRNSTEYTRDLLGNTLEAKDENADPLGDPDGWNNLAYVNNSVTMAIDWMGLAEWSSHQVNAGDVRSLTIQTATAWQRGTQTTQQSGIQASFQSAGGGAITGSYSYSVTAYESTTTSVTIGSEFSATAPAKGNLYLQAVQGYMDIATYQVITCERLSADGNWYPYAAASSNTLIKNTSMPLVIYGIRTKVEE